MVVVITFVLISCQKKNEHYSYIASQSEAVKRFRQEGYFEYASRLNDSLLKELESIDSNVLKKNTLKMIKELDLKLKSEKQVLGCYVIPWMHHENTQVHENVMMLEWNYNFGVIIRIFTKSNQIKHLLPSQSY
ncbi:hypothetical protein ACFO5O_14645 [Geojedonia litorea]|uniref:Lipoprotein n=2 Tax=Geojedonia litorea TaxID=1268269 RepID=A0ABV9N5H4_9FLAO